MHDTKRKRRSAFTVAAPLLRPKETALAAPVATALSAFARSSNHAAERAAKVVRSGLGLPFR